MDSFSCIHTFEKLVRAKDFIDKNFALPINLDLIAYNACLSPYHFLRLFKRVFYKTPNSYLREKRIEKAKELLMQTGLSVTEICFEVGFESVGTFATTFHRLTGFPPAAYRARVYRFFNLGFRIPRHFIPSCFSSNYRFSA